MHAPQNLESAVALCLREPLAVSRRLLKLNNSFIAALEQRRNRAMSSNYLARHLSRFLFPQQEQ
ncbi:MAG: hypothetical protein RL120_13165, partial [Gammaproteobacteria bacterium]